MDITFAGEIATVRPGRSGPSKPALAFMEVVKAGNQGLTDEELAGRIEYKSREKGPRTPDSSESSDGHRVPETGAEDLLNRLIRLVRDGQIQGVRYGDLTEHLGRDLATVDTDAEEVIQEAFLLCIEKNSDFTQDDFIRLLSDVPGSSGQRERLDVTDWDTMSVFGTHGPPEVITSRDKALCIKCYVELHYKEIPRRQAEIADAKADFLRMRADGLRGVVESAEANNRQEAIARKKALGELDVERHRIRELENQVIRLGQIRDEYYRIGLKSTPVKSTANQVIGFRVAAPASKVADAVRQYKKRLIDSLTRGRSAVPQSLIDHIQQHWIHERGVHRYTGAVNWQINP